LAAAVLILDPRVSGRTFIPKDQLDDYEDLEFVSRAMASYNSEEIINAIQRADYAFVLQRAMPHALAGNADAQCTIALLYEGGLGVQIDFLEAERWLLKATAQNSALAWHNLGTLCATKHPGLEHRWGEARMCWEKAAELAFVVADL
jgi:TPR repeat protein